MDSIPYTPSLTDELIRRKLLIICGFIGAPLFIWFSLVGYSLDHNEMVTITVGGAAVCLINLIVSWIHGFNRNLVRLSVGYVLLTCAYYVYADYDASSLLFCLVVPFIPAILLGFKEAIAWNVAFGIVCIFMVFNTELLGLSTIYDFEIDFTSSYILSVALALGYEKTRQNAQDRASIEHEKLLMEIEKKNEIAARNQKLFEDLHEALREVRELTGLIPICASCKKIRADEGFWEHVEAYLHKRTRLTFSHSFCPTCTDDAMDELGAGHS